MIENVEKYIREIFPNVHNLIIDEIDGKFRCEYTYYVSDIYGKQMLRKTNVKVGLVDGFFKIVG